MKVDMAVSSLQICYIGYERQVGVRIENQLIFVFFPLKFVGRVTKPNYMAYFYKLLDI